MLADIDPNDGTFANGRCSKWFAVFDEIKLRPFLIRNYTMENAKNQDMYNELITKNFDDQEPEELVNQIDNMTQKSRFMSVTATMVRNTLALRASNVGGGRRLSANSPSHLKVDNNSIPNFGITMVSEHPKKEGLYQSVAKHEERIIEVEDAENSEEEETQGRNDLKGAVNEEQ